MSISNSGEMGALAVLAILGIGGVWQLIQGWNNDEDITLWVVIAIIIFLATLIWWAKREQRHKSNRDYAERSIKDLYERVRAMEERVWSEDE